MRFLVRLLASAVALAAATAIVDGITIEQASRADQATTLLIVAVVFGLLNAVIRPILRLLTFPLLLLTLGLFALVINGFMLLLASWVSDWLGVPFTVEGFWSAVLGALVISIVSFVVNVALPDRYES